jgi:hypothetical protein
MLFAILLTLFCPQEEEPDVEVTIHGYSRLEWVSRNGSLNETSFWNPGGIDPTSPFRKSDDFFSPMFGLTLRLKWKERINAFIELRNLQIKDDGAVPLQNERLDTDSDIDLHFRQAYVSIEEWPIKNLEWSIGSRKIENRTDHPLFLSSGSESPWEELPDSTVPPFPAAGSNTVPQTRRMELLMTGIHAHYTAQSWNASGWILPELGGEKEETKDESFYGASWTKLFESATLTLTAAWMGGGDSGRIWTVGAQGAMEKGSLTARLESFFQFGKVGGRDAQGIALRASLRADLDPLWGSIEYLWVSGDEDGSDNKEGRFLSYEDNDTAPLVEGNEFGLDIDNNYSVFRISLGYLWKFSRNRNPIQLETRIHYFTLEHRVPLFPDPQFNISSRSRELGVEWDLHASYNLSEAIQLHAGVSALFASEVLEQFTSEGEESAWLTTVGTSFRF